MPTLSSRLKQAMGDKIKPVDLANACRISRAAVTKWFSGKQQDLKMAHLYAVAKLCDVDPEWLALGNGPIRRGYATRGVAPPAPQFERRHIALLQAYLRLPDAQRLAVRMLIETLDGSQNPRLHEFMQQIEEHNHVRDRQSGPAALVETSADSKKRRT